MTWYAEAADWSAVDAPPDDGHAIQVHAVDGDTPAVSFRANGTEVLRLTGANPRPQTDTTHTVARVPPDAGSAAVLFAVHAAGQDLVFDARESAHEEAVDLDRVRSALNEIMIPVYIDDVVSDLSEQVSGLLVLHTAQYRDPKAGDWSYFRVSAFREGELLMEEEHGAL